MQIDVLRTSECNVVVAGCSVNDGKKILRPRTIVNSERRSVFVYLKGSCGASVYDESTCNFGASKLYINPREVNN